jgi:hypothetical protein
MNGPFSPDILFARLDGVELAWYWLENLLRQIPRGRHLAQFVSAIDI